MAPPSARGLRSWLLGAAVVAVLAGAAVWAAPWLARMVVHTQRGGGRRVESDPAQVDAFVGRALPEAGAVRALSSQDAEGVQRATWQLRPDTTAEQATAALREAARAAGVELHAVPRDTLDAEVRVYAGSALRHEVLLIPSLPADSPPPRAVNRRERPLVALVVAGLGPREATGLVRTPAPLTLAVEPYTPFALATARDAALAWQEVLVEVTEGEDAAAALQAVPFATGALARGAAGEGAAAALGTGLLVVERDLPRPPGEALLVVQPWHARQRALEDLLARIRHLALRDGGTAVLVEADAPALPGLLQWATEGHARGYRVVHASELARQVDVVGILDANNPRAKEQ